MRSTLPRARQCRCRGCHDGRRPALYLIGESLVRLRMIKLGEPQRSLSVVTLAAVGVLGRDIPALALSGRRDPGRPDDLGPRAVPPRSGPFSRISLHEAEQDGGTT